MSKIESIPFGKLRIGPGNPTVVIAEIGINHEGSFETCAEMIRAAAASGVSAMKLQTIDPDRNYVVGTESHDLFSKAQLSRDDTARAFDLARQLGIEPLTTAGDAETIEWVEQLEPAAHKVSSGLLTNSPVLETLASLGRSLLISTGMAEQQDIDEAVECIKTAGSPPFAIFQCTSLYPTPPARLNLRAIRLLGERYNVPTGLSDHSEGVRAASLAVAGGAAMIEKHFSLDPSRPSFDHRLSLDPAGLRELVQGVREADEMMGTGAKVLDEDEKDARRRFHRVLVATRDISAGEVLSASDVTPKRPLPGTTGLAPRFHRAVIGRVIVRDLKLDETISIQDLEEAVLT